MKPAMVCLAFTFLFLQNVKSQDSLQSNEPNSYHPVYIARINFQDGQSFKGYLMDIRDSSLFVYHKKRAAADPFHFHKINLYADSGWRRYHYKFVESIKVNDKKTRSRTIVAGTLIGIIVGAAIGISQGTDEGLFALTAGAKGVIGGIIGGGAGALTGLAISSAFEKKYLINGEWKSFEELKAGLKY